jgi:hypothetical protein
MNNNDIIEKYFFKLFTSYFNEIEITDKLKNDYSWENISCIFKSLYNNLLELTTQTEFIENYYLITLLYINYTNFLKYINHKDSESVEIFDYLKKIKNNSKIIQYICENLNYKNFDNIFDTFNPFIKNKVINYPNISETQLTVFISNVKQLEKIYLDSNISSKRILNTVLYKYILSNDVSINFNDFYINKIIEGELSYDFDYKTIIETLPYYKNIINLNVSQEIKNNLGVHLSQLINFLIKDNNNLYLNTIINSDKTKFFEIINTKIGGKIIIKKSSNKTNEINIYQQNINLIGFNIKELKNYSFIKKTNNLIVIEYSTSIINNLSLLLHLTHLITCGIKLLETYASSIYECLYPIDYNKYYYISFVNFLTFIKPNINNDMSYNRFIIDLIKYYYIYSYYDYYFYYNTNLVKTIIERIKHKNNIFNEFCESLTVLFKLPLEMKNYPPFFNIADDIDDLIYYSFEIPNYFKFMDFINALVTVFSVEISTSNKFDLFKVILLIKCDIINNKIEQNKTVDTVNKVIQCNKDSDKQNSTVINDKLPYSNAYIEINADNDENFVLDTEIK